MLYVGHFSFSYESRHTKPPEPWYGHLTALVEAKDAAAAVSKCRALLRNARKHRLVTDAREIYLHAVVEVRSMPAAGLITHLEVNRGADITGIWTSAPMTSGRHVRSYHHEPEDIRAGQQYRPEPFVVFAENPVRKRKRKAVSAKKKAAPRGAAKGKKPLE
jgi:hypothetical protein